MEEIMKQAQELIQQVYKCGFKDGRKDGIEEGRNETLEAVKKIYLSVDYGGLSDDELYDIFREGCLFDIFNKFSASEVIARIKDYDEKKKQEENKIKVGDVVKLNDHSAVVTYCDSDHWSGICIQGIDDSEVGMTYHAMQYYGWTKTGETIPEIVKVLKK